MAAEARTGSALQLRDSDIMGGGRLDLRWAGHLPPETGLGWQGSVVKLVKQQPEPTMRCVVGSIPAGTALEVWPWTSFVIVTWDPC